jgi:hypothetical protein
MEATFWYMNTTIPIYYYCKLEKDEAFDVGYLHRCYGKEELFRREERIGGLKNANKKTQQPSNQVIDGVG